MTREWWRRGAISLKSPTKVAGDGEYRGGTFTATTPGILSASSLKPVPAGPALRSYHPTRMPGRCGQGKDGVEKVSLPIAAVTF